MTFQDIPSQGTGLDFNLDNPFEDLGFLSEGHVFDDTPFDSENHAAAADDISWFAHEIPPVDSANGDGQGQSIEPFQQNAPRYEAIASSAPDSLAYDPSALSSITSHIPTESNTGTSFPREPNAHDPSLSVHDTAQTTATSKSGIRFNKEAVRILKHWLSTHSSHPYPDESERRRLQGQTGLNKTQIANWLANARRRGKIPPSRATSFHTSSSANPIEVPKRLGTPAIHAGSSQLNPLERWVDSPPENEPASASAIARAMASPSHESLRHIDSLSHKLARNDSEKSFGNTSSAQSVDTSCSSGISLVSATSNASHASLGSFQVFMRPRSRRRKRMQKQSDVKTTLSNPWKTFQCTFCTETFSASSKFTAWPMKRWKVAMPEIRSRCGFCGHTMDTWDARVHHLATHFKAGKTMADWKGDWGFDPEIVVLVENSIPPYFIHIERTTPFPFEGSRALAETPRSAFELIKLELAYFMQNQFDKNSRMPSKEEMQLEACRIMLASETAYRQDGNQQGASPFSWLHDLIMSDDDIVQKAKMSPIRSPAESRLFTLKINGKNSLFEDCPFEAQLHDFVQSRHLLGQAISLNELKEETCYIIGRMEEVSTTPSGFIANWLVTIIHSTPDWLCGFRRRANISMAEDVETQERNIDANIRDYTNLEREMATYLDMQRRIGIEPTDEDLRSQARIIIYGSDVGYNHTAADDNYWLLAFKQRHLPDSYPFDVSIEANITQAQVSMPLYPLSINPTVSNHSSPQGLTETGDQHSILEARSLVMKAGSFFISDPNFYRWITEELGRWVTATMSPHNPACHVPSDEEIQHYARWITYNDDDPLNQTIAENRDWLDGFKRDMGILSEAAFTFSVDN
ncbi:hypothetical protein AK830_g1192 [Neonectria ditissima]|uniref:Homeobox domain-containing protein n=1 Tax=Neonectria ditissima TaxID=78410 RepID=A0A0P7BUU0_9HYPO|nr:hypothetical protein AK830_g1192 [Neonectria ditissima]